MNKRTAGILICTLIALMAILAIGPLDVFTHGFFCDEIDTELIDDADKLGTADVGSEESVLHFSPEKKYFTGFEIYLVNQSRKNKGKLILEVFDQDNVSVDRIEADLSDIRSSEWYRAYSNAALKEGEEYTLVFSVENAKKTPSLQLVDPGYLPDESISGNILIGYAYREPVFTFHEKFIICMFIISVWGLAVWLLLRDSRMKKRVKAVSVFLLLTAILTWNFMFNSMDDQNTTFDWFHYDTETLVMGSVYAERDGISSYRDNEQGYGLGLYRTMRGIYKSYYMDYITDDNWLDGYNRTMPAIIVSRNASTIDTAVEGYSIRFKNGEEYKITQVIKGEDNIVMYLDAARALSPARNGSLDDTVFYDDNHREIAKTVVTAYVGQYGLQGKVFRHLSHLMKEENIIQNLHLICSVLAAAVFVIISFMLSRKYNYVLAGCFYIVFWLSPWVVNFARNFYWLEFIWFVPAALGLLCVWKLENLKCRIFCYAASFAAILVKCLCGYEYISAVMMGLIAFPVIELLAAFAAHDRKKIRLLVRSIFILGILALLGFAAALCLHARLKGEGNIIDGVKGIIVDDVLRRTNGADLNNYDSEFWPSMNASIWETLCLYFHFSTQIITGIPGNLFPLLCLAPIGIFVYRFVRGKHDYKMISAYAFFFLTSISWFCLAKSHSYMHTHINFVLWYFGFVQICFYVIVKQILEAVGAGRKKIMGSERH